MPADPDLLRNIPFFQTLDDDDRAMIAELMTEARFPPRAVIFRENDPGGTLFVISEGRVQLSIVADDGNTVLLAALDPGEFFGEVSLLDGGGRSATAETLDDEVLAFSLSREPLLKLIRRRSDVALDMVTALGRRMRKTDESLRRRVRNPNEVLEERVTFGERVADAVARFGGSWSFIITFGVILTVWVLLNSAFLLIHRSNGEPLDPYPFILLNLVLSMLAALQAPVIMMSQNRQDAKDRVRNELEYHVNIKAEMEILQLLERVDALKHQIERLELPPPVRPPGAADASEA